MSFGPYTYDLSLVISGSKTQTSTARVQKTPTTTQTAVANIQPITIGPYTYDLQLNVTFSKTQSAIANIQLPVYTKTQSATAKIQKIFTKTQPAIANIGSAFGPYVYDLQLSGTSIAQNATARIAVVGSKAQPAIANISTWILIYIAAANSVSYDDYTVVHGKTYRYRVAPVIDGVVGDYVYSENILYTGGTITTKTQSAVARIAIRASNNLMMGYNF